MAIAPIEIVPGDPTKGFIRDGSMLEAPGSSGQPTVVPNTAQPSSLAGTIQPAVVTSQPARQETQANQNALRDIVLELQRRQAVDAQNAAAKAEADKKAAADASLVNAAQKEAGVQQPRTTPEYDQARSDLNNSINQMDQLMARMDSNSSGLMASIQNEFAGLIRQQEELNKKYEAGTTTEGYRSGRARYAPLLQGQIIAGAVSSGLAKISDLQAKKMRLIMEAQSAQDDKSFRALNAKMDAYREIIKEERQLAQDTYENAMKASADARAQMKAEQENERFAWDYASTIAPSLANEVSEIKDPVMKANYIQSIATQIGIDPSVLFGEVQKYTDTNDARNTSEIKQYEYAKNQGFKGTLLQYHQAIAAAGRAPKEADTLTAYEAASRGLPQTLVGMSEAAISSQLNSPNPPSWFTQMGRTKEEWNSFRFSVPSTSTGNLTNALLNSYLTTTPVDLSE